MTKPNERRYEEARLCTCHTTGSYSCPVHEPDPPERHYEEAKAERTWEQRCKDAEEDVEFEYARAERAERERDEALAKAERLELILYPHAKTNRDLSSPTYERMSEDEQDLAAEIRRLDALLVQTRKDAMNELAAQVERAQQAERERDEAFRVSEQERADWKLSVAAWQHHYEEEKEALRLERGRKLDALLKYEQLRKVLEEIAAYEDDCIHRRMARAALAEWEKP